MCFFDLKLSYQLIDELGNVEGTKIEKKNYASP